VGGPPEPGAQRFGIGLTNQQRHIFVIAVAFGWANCWGDDRCGIIVRRLRWSRHWSSVDHCCGEVADMAVITFHQSTH
jgi:hypothetical protein